MELRQLRQFVAVCEAGSLTRAGARLHTAQQSLSQTVATLESELGVRLLDRGAFGVRPTDAGRVLWERGAALLRDADAVARAVRDTGGHPTGTVRLRYGLDSEHLVRRLLADVRARLPQLTVAGWTGPDSDNVRALRAGDADLVLAWAVDGHLGDLPAVTVAAEDCWAAVPADDPLATADAVPVAALAGRALVMFPRESAPWVWDHIAGHLTAGRPAPRITRTAVSGQAAMVDAALTLGAICPVSRGLIGELERPGVRFLPFAPALSVPAQLVWRAGPAPAVAAVIAAATAGAATRPRQPAEAAATGPVTGSPAADQAGGQVAGAATSGRAAQKRGGSV